MLNISSMMAAVMNGVVFGAVDPVVELQQSLKALATATGNTALDPRRVDGQLDNQTIMAIAAAARSISQLPSELKQALQYAPILTTLSSDLRNWVLGILRSNAAYITKAVQILALRVGQTVPGQKLLYPAGTIYTRGKVGYRVGVPKGTSVVLGAAVMTLSGADLAGCIGCAQDSPVDFLSGDPTHNEVTKPGESETPTPPPTASGSATEVSQPAFEEKTGTRPIYKKAWFWGVSAGSAIALITAGYFLFRKG